MIVYLSARYPRQAELRDYREQLEHRGITVLSRWLDAPADAVATVEHANMDVDDIYEADVFVAFAEATVPAGTIAPEAAARGGRHVEFGIAYESGIRCLVVAPPQPRVPFGNSYRIDPEPYEGENVFHLLPGVGRASSWPEALAAIVAMAEAEIDDRWRERIATIGEETVAALAQGDT